MDQSGSSRITSILWAAAIFLAMILLSLVGDPGRWHVVNWPLQLALAGGFALGFAGLSLARFKGPRTSLLLALLGACGYYAAGLPSLALMPALMVFLYCAANVGYQFFAGVSALTLHAVMSLLRILAGQDPRIVLGYELLANLAVSALAIMLALLAQERLKATRQERKIQDGKRQLSDVMSKATAKFEADRRWMADRSKMFLNAQDELAHYLALATLHGNAALESANSGHSSIASLEHIRDSTRQALGALRRTVDSLSEEETGLRTAGTFGNIIELVSSLRDAGVRVDMNAPGVDLDDRLPILLMRFLREAATNAVIHADTTHLVIFLRPQPPQQNRNLWHVSVRNDGVRRKSVSFTGGVSLTNLRRKIAEAGGSMEWGQLGNHFLLSAEIWQNPDN